MDNTQILCTSLPKQLIQRASVPYSPMTLRLCSILAVIFQYPSFQDMTMFFYQGVLMESVEWHILQLSHPIFRAFAI